MEVTEGNSEDDDGEISFYFYFCELEEMMMMKR